MAKAPIFFTLWMTLALTPVLAQAPLVTEKAIDAFEGSGSLTTRSFETTGKWEIRWRGLGPQHMAPLSVHVYTFDRKEVATFSGALGGTFGLNASGFFYLQIDGAKPPANAAPGDTTPSWHLDIVQVAAPGSGSTPALTSGPAAGPAVTGTGAPIVGGGNNNNVSSNPNELTKHQSHSIVIVSGDKGTGTGFFVKTPEGPAVLTNIHVIFDNPNLKITTVTGQQVKMLSAKGAADRDLALLYIEDQNYEYSTVATDINESLNKGDTLIAPGNSEGLNVVLNTLGNVVGVGPDRIEISNPLFHGNSGGPLINSKTGKVVGVATMAYKVVFSDDLDRNSFQSRFSAINNDFRYFGLRFDTVPNWIPINWNRFAYESHFLNDFNKLSVALDSLINKAANSAQDLPYQQESRIQQIVHRYLQSCADDPAHLDKCKADLIFDLNDMADTDMDYIKDQRNFHSFDWERVNYEIKYREALKKELDQITKNTRVLNTKF